MLVTHSWFVGGNPFIFEFIMDIDTKPSANVPNGRKRRRSPSPSPSSRRLCESERRIKEMDAEIEVMREQLQELRAALRHSQDYTTALKHDSQKIEDDNNFLMDQVFVLEEKVAAYEVCGAGELELKPINAMTIVELVGVADSARRLLRAVQQRVLAWCNAPVV